MPQHKALKQKETDFIIFKNYKTSFVSKRKKAINSFKNASNDLILYIALNKIPQKSQGGKTVKQEPSVLKINKIKTV